MKVTNFVAIKVIINFDTVDKFIVKKCFLFFGNHLQRCTVYCGPIFL